MTVAEMRERKKELGYSYEQIAEKSGVPLSTVQKVFSGATESPRYSTLLAIEKVLLHAPTSRVAETAAEYGKKLVKKQGEYTVEDYYNWPEDERIELIDGVIYDLAPPTIKHQDIVSELTYLFMDYVKKNKDESKVYGTNIDVQLDCNDKTMVVPDIVILCERDKLTERNLFGAPDLVVEVLSPSTRKKDMSKKVGKYGEAGVREYWIVDPQKEIVVVYEFSLEDENDAQIKFYSFSDQIPVGIWNGECVVDFAEIKESLFS